MQPIADHTPRVRESRLIVWPKIAFDWSRPRAVSEI
jgi:hypothetical protein